MTRRLDQSRVCRRVALGRIAAGGLATCLRRVSPVFAGTWPSEWEADSVNFHADFRIADDALAKQVLALTRTVPKTCRLAQSDEPIHVYLFRHHATFEEYLQHYFPSVPKRRALFIKQRGPGMVFAYESDELAIDLRHEMTHAILHTLLPMVPLWLDEGLAEYFEVAAAERLTANPHMRDLQRHLKWKRLPRLAPLERLTDIREMNSGHYRDAWAWVHFLLHGPAPVRAELHAYLRDIRAQTVPGQLSARLQRRLPHLHTAFRQHFA